MPPEHYRHDGIDGLRGLAAVSVIFYQAILLNKAMVGAALYPPIQDIGHPYLVASKLFLFLFNGQNAVYLFFVISGLVLSLSLRRSPTNTGDDLVRFVIRRAFRLYPALVFCLIVCALFAAVALLVGPPLWGFGPFYNALKPLLFLQNATLVGIPIHGPSWAVQAEVIAVPFVLLGGVIARRAGVAGMVAYLVATLVAWYFGPVWVMKDALPAFAAGMLIADAGIGRAFGALPRFALVLLVPIYLFGRLFMNMADPVGYVFQIVICTLLVGAVFYSGGQGLLDRVLGSAPLRSLGRRSYSLYLLNVPVMWVVSALLRPTGLYEIFGLEAGLFTGLVVFLLTWPLAGLSERFVERNGIRWGVHWARLAAPVVELPNPRASRVRMLIMGLCIALGLGAIATNIQGAGAQPAISDVVGFVNDGDSITQGFGVTPNYPSTLAAQTSVQTWNTGVPGRFLASMDAEYALAVAPYYAPDSLNTVVILGGTNDLIKSGATADQLRAWLISYCAKARATGFQVIVGTIMNSVFINPSQEVERQAFNTWIRANYRMIANALADFDANPSLGNPADATYFLDGLHLTSAGYAVMAEVVRVASGLPLAGSN